jgi:hypothetical protein
MKRRNVGIAAILVILANAWVLVSVWLNRADTPGGTVELTERELRLERVSDESTVLFLKIEWDTLRSKLPGDPHHWRSAEWLDAAKMADLGFPPPPVLPTADDPHVRYRSYTIPVYVVLEFEGEAWKQAPANRRQATRLFAVDAGHDPQLLRERYPDPTRHILTRGLVRSFLERRTSPDGERLPPRLRGTLRQLLSPRIFISDHHDRELANLSELDRDSGQQGGGDPRFTATVSWGTDYVPWLQEVRLR